jgi:hypothetical protein
MDRLPGVQYLCSLIEDVNGGLEYLAKQKLKWGVSATTF